MTSLWMMTLCDVINFVVAVCSCTPNLAYKLRILTQRFPAKFKLQTDFFLFRNSFINVLIKMPKFRENRTVHRICLQKRNYQREAVCFAV